LRRERLFALLDQAKGRAVWICGAPGSGKSTLVSSWIEVRRAPNLYYRVRSSDADLASFFYELGARAGGRRGPLPSFTPEYRGGESAFARRFFRELTRGHGPSWVLVLDDMERVASAQPLLDLLRDAIEELPTGVRAILVSREQPPASFARLLANGVVSVVGGEALRLTPPEALAIARARAPAWSRQDLERACRRAAGWVAGLVLLVTRSADEAGGEPEPKTLFSYLANELLDRADPETRSILVQVAVPPILPARILGALCDSDRALGLLRDLAARAFFVVLRGREDPVFELHPLARELLLKRARADLTPERLRAIERRAAGLLAQAGSVDEAIDLFLQAEAWEDAAQLVFLQAPRLVATGRTSRLEGWLEALPAALAERHPWLRYWRGVCRLAFDPPAARSHLAGAWECFAAAGDARGLHLAFAAAIESFILEWADLRGMDEWIDRFEAVAAMHHLPKAEFALRSAAAMFAALAFHRLDSPARPEWERRALEIVHDPSLPPGPRLATGANLLVECAFLGEGGRAAEVVGALGPLARGPGADPMSVLAWLAAEAVYFWHAGSPSSADHAASLGLQLGRESGIHAWDCHLQQRILAALAAGEPGKARAYLAALQASLPAPSVLLSLSLLEMENLLALHEGDASRAVRVARELAAASDMGLAFAKTLTSMNLALALVEAGDAAARSQLEALRRDGTGSALAGMIAELAQAELERRSGDLSAAREHLERGLRLSREKGIAPDVWFSHDRLAGLSALALDSGIETEHVLGLVRRLELHAPAGCTSQRWPWRVRIRLFGPFELLVGGTPLRLPPRARRRPLDVLPALAARGRGTETAQAVAGALWPESDGDLAHHALETATYRLRRMVGEDIVQHRQGQVRLDTGQCWVDALGFEAFLGRTAAALQHRNTEAALASAESAIALYRGPFLAGREEPWVLSARERYRLLLARCLSDLERLGADRAAVRRLRGRAEAADPGALDPSRSGKVATS
jgi:hypothetical protein